MPYNIESIDQPITVAEFLKTEWILLAFPALVKHLPKLAKAANTGQPSTVRADNDRTSVSSSNLLSFAHVVFAIRGIAVGIEVLVELCDQLSYLLWDLSHRI